MKHPLLRVSWLARHAFALLMFVMMISLGFWQLDRLEQRRAANALRLAVLDQNPITVTPDVDPQLLLGRRVRLSGTLRNAESVLLRGRPSDSGVPGVHLLTPLQLSGSETAVLVDRGWLPVEQAAAERRAAFAIERELTIEGIALPPQTRPDAPLAPMDVPLAGETRIDGWIRADVPLIQQQVDIALLPFYVEQLPIAGSSSLPRPPDPRLLDEGPHLGYALQWFTFAAMLGVVYAALMRQEIRKINVSLAASKSVESSP